MSQASEPSLKFLQDHVRWCLSRPLVYGERDWANRVSRALDRLAEAFDLHIEQWDAPGGPSRRLADPSLLPFTPEAHQVAQLRTQHAALRARLHGVAAQFRNALALFPPHLDTSLRDPAADDVQEVRVFRLFGVLDPLVGDLLADLDAHRAAEEQALEGTDRRDESPGRRLSHGPRSPGEGGDDAPAAGPKRELPPVASVRPGG
jgi:hypothetical protein